MFKFEEKFLLQQTRRGNQSAFSRLYDNYQDKIYRFIYFRVSSESLAQDLTSETFIKVLQYLINGNDIDDFQSFIYQTARNLIVDFYRQRGKTELPIDKFVEENLSDKSDPAESMDKKFTLSEIEAGLNQLPENYREVIALRFIEDLPFKQIAQIMDIKEDNARMLAHRGLKILQKTLINKGL